MCDKNLIQLTTIAEELLAPALIGISLLISHSNPLEKIKVLSGFTYNWSLDKCKKAGFIPSNERQIGVFAQDVQSVIPEAVKPAPFDTIDGKSKSGDETINFLKGSRLLIKDNVSVKKDEVLIEYDPNENYIFSCCFFLKKDNNDSFF